MTTPGPEAEAGSAPVPAQSLYGTALPTRFQDPRFQDPSLFQFPAETGKDKKAPKALKPPNQPKPPKPPKPPKQAKPQLPPWAVQAPVPAQPWPQPQPGQPPQDPWAAQRAAPQSWPAQAPEARNVRKRRTGLLFTSAIILGLLGGIGTGYAIQAKRAPTALPALDQPIPQLGPPVGTAAPSAAPSTASAADLAGDDQLTLDGDLRKLVIDKPAGAKDWVESPYVNGWEGLDYYTLDYNTSSQADIFTQLTSAGLRRIAGRTWIASDGTQVNLALLQFRTTSGAQSVAARDHKATLISIPGTASGTVYDYPDKNRDGSYTGVARLVHGTVMVEIWAFSDNGPVKTSMLQNLATQQMAKL